MSQQINFYQAEFRPRRVPFPAAGMLRAALLWLLGLAAIYGYGAWQLREARGSLQQLERRVQQIEQRVEAQRRQQDGGKQAAELLQQAEAAEAKLQALNQAAAAVEAGAIGSDKGFSGHFSAFSRAVVPGVWLTGFQIGARGEIVKLSGRALDSEGPARFLHGLREQALFQGLQFAFLQIAKGGDGRYLDFTLQAQVEPAALNAQPAVQAPAPAPASEARP
ncbi:MAG: PilN domain-containing protein [Pseudomonadota bacterium]